MSLNIKDPEAHRLAKRIAGETGQSLTETVVQALREKLERLEDRSEANLVDELNAIVQRAAPHIRRPYVDHASLLYDENGAPK